ncbi:hypothetical protein [Asticcacaulis sp.]|uniref:hypothetical protein n=1 Tax=Asticcacaulis sp. TaxID=1872648 RepID=UPI002634F0DA|nr:hypothetical protein [Asticcacaulis sp.]
MNAAVPNVPDASAAPLAAAQNPFATRVNDEGGGQDNAHTLRPGIKCGTEDKGHAVPRSRSIYEIVVDASGGFIPLWEAGVTLNWRFREASFQRFSDPGAAKTAIERLSAKALIAWGKAWPALVFGEHRPFSIMNYGDNCQLTDQDRLDLKRLYTVAWLGELKEINGTQTRFVRPYHNSGSRIGSNGQVVAFSMVSDDSRS